jgi:hypothetical protein
MRKVGLLTAVLTSAVTVSAWAQEAPYSQTLDEQQQRVAQGQAAVPLAPAQAVVPRPIDETTTVTTRKTFREWPASASPAAGTATPAYSGATRARDGEVIDSMGSGAIPALPIQMMEANGIQYITGGVGDEEEAQIKSMQHQFNLRVLMTGSQGEYLSNAMVRVMDASGNQVLSVSGAGPYFYTRLNPGTYTVEVTAPQGGIKKATVHVPASGAVNQDFRFSV